MSLAETAVLQLLVDPEVRTIAGPHLKEWMFESEVNKVALRVLLDKFNGVRPDPQNFVLEMYKYSAVTEDDCYSLVSILRAAPQYDDAGIARALTSLESFIQEKMVASSITKIAKQGMTPSAREDMSNSLNFSLGNDKEFVNFATIESIKAVQEKSLPPGGRIVKSYFNIINQSSIYKGLKYGDLLTICAETGVGKTTAGICEGGNAAAQGFKVCHVFLGDMTEFDAAVGYMSFWTGELTEKLIYDYEEYYTEDVAKKFENVRIRTFPADSINIYELISKLHALYKEFEFDVLIIDYDGNFRDTGSDSMYKEGGAVYNQLKGFSDGRCVTVIMSQVKPSYWGVEIGAKDALVESSKKQHAIDFMLYIGKNQDCSRIGSITLCKVRRGQDQLIHRIIFKNMYSRIVEIGEESYQQLLAESKENKTGGSITLDMA